MAFDGCGSGSLKLWRQSSVASSVRIAQSGGFKKHPCHLQLPIAMRTLARKPVPAVLRLRAIPQCPDPWLFAFCPDTPSRFSVRMPSQNVAAGSQHALGPGVTALKVARRHRQGCFAPW